MIFPQNSGNFTEISNVRDFFAIFLPENLECRKIVVPLHRFPKERAFSSAGSEHLPYKQRVGGSNPSTPTPRPLFSGLFLFSAIMRLNWHQRKMACIPA